MKAKRAKPRRAVHPVQPAHHMPVWGPAGSMTPIKVSAEYRGSVDLRKLARGRPCMVRLPGCDGGGETTVLAHFRLLPYSGAGFKNSNLAFGAWSCAVCHDLIDSRTWGGNENVRFAHAIGVMRTIAELEKLGIVKCSS
jgi:hypothetical protein